MTMGVYPVGSNNPSSTVDPTGFDTRFQSAFTPVAQLFGESPDQLLSELDSGSSLSALAQQKGISQDDLIAAIKQGLRQSSANNGSTLSDTQLTNIANRIAHHRHGGHHHHHHHHHGGVEAAGTTSDASGVSGAPGTAGTGQSL